MLFLCGSSWAYELFVSSTADTLGCDGTRTNPFPTIQAAIDDAFSYDPANPTISEVTIVVEDGVYEENLIIDFGISISDNYVSKLSIIGENNDPSNCSIIGQSNSDYTIQIQGNLLYGLLVSSFYISGFSINHVNNCYGIYYPPGKLIENTIDHCRFEDCGLGAISDSGYYYNLTTYIQYSVFVGLSNSDVSIRLSIAALTENQIIIESCDFIGSELNNYWLDFWRNPIVTLSNNRFFNTVVEFSNFNITNETKVFVHDNRFENSTIQTFQTNISISDNTFLNYCPSLQGSDFYYAPVKIRNDFGSSRMKTEINRNIFALSSENDYNYPLPIRIYKGGSTGPYLSNNLVVTNNSFLRYPKIIGIPVDTNNTSASYQNQISMFRNNLCMDNASSPFDIFSLNGIPDDLPLSAQFTMDHCLFQEEIENSNSYLIGSGVINGVPENESVIEVNPVDNTYSLVWDNDYRSRVIMAGYGINGVGTPFHSDRLDIGAVQYSEYPHEYVTYTFPPYSQRNGLKWMSFPTLDRIWNPTTNEPDVANTFFDPILNPMVLDKITWKVQAADAQDIQFVSGSWQGYLSHYIIPQQGYKIQMAQGLQNEQSIAVPGIIPNVSENPVTLKAYPYSKAPKPDNENWLGYFHTGTVDARDAFNEVLDNLWSIQTQNWTMVRENMVPSSPWIMAYQNGKEPTLSYGDMVVVKCFGDDQFYWNTVAENQIPIEKELPSHFIYEEKPDYIPLYVELDSSDLPSELALYVDNVCKGAAVVCDSLVEIPGYIVDDINPEAEVEIRAYYADKAAVDQIPAFLVWNNTSGAYENKPLVLNRKNYYYKVKLVQGEGETPVASLATMEIYPNPFNPSTTIKFNLPEATEIKLEIYNLKGQLVRSLVHGNVDSGKQSVSWDGTDNHNRRVGSGLYYSKLSYQDKSIVQKMVMIK